MTHKALAIAATLAAFGGTLSGLPAGSAPATHTVVQAVQTDVAGANVDSLRSRLERARTTLTEAQATEAKAQRHAEQASQAATDAAAAAKQAAAAAERADKEHAGAHAEAHTAKVELGRLAAYAYANTGTVSELAQLGAAFNPAEFQARSTNLTELIRVQDVLLQQAATARADAANAAARTAAQAEAAAAAADRAKKLANDARAALNTAAAATRRAESALRELQRAHANAQRAASERARANRAPARSRRQSAPATTVAPRGGATFARPSTGRITSPYGMRTHPLTGVYKLHSGTDFGAPCGAGAHAAYGGTVEETGYAGAYGNRITIAHGQISGLSVTTTYNHLSSIGVRRGQRVTTGQTIGRVGTTGSSTGCHLHFEVLTNGSFTNPMSWL